MNPAQQKANAKKFIERWQNEPGNEEEQSRSFWIQLLEEVLGIQNATHVLQFERKVKGRKIDVFYEDMGILIEQKGRGISLDEATVRSKKVGPETPYQQACWYANNLPFSIRPRWIITCNFDEIRIYDQDQEDTDHYETVLLENLSEESHRLSFFTDKKHSRIEQEKQLSVQAGEIVGKLYNQLSAQYKNIETDKHEQYSLNVLIVRLVFLIYAEDAGLLQRKDAFLDYMKQFNASQMRTALISLFDVLNTPEDKRDPYLAEDLLEFPYINGDLYSNKANITIPQFTDQIRLDLLLEASQKFDWKKISPTIFGAVFESTLNPETRRAGGMHYTSVENIHKVIDPLFLNDLTKELEKIEGEKVEKNRKIMLQAFQKKLASLNIFDPACGSGNFLTESYLSLRKLENRVIESLQGDQISFDLDTESLIQVSISQFYGIEINDFAVSVAKTALWIAEEQMMEATQEIVMAPFDFLPLKSNSNIHEGNALRMDWNDVLPAEKCSYICGNPPFVARAGRMSGEQNSSKGMTSADQKKDKQAILGQRSGNLDYVACWFKKAALYSKKTNIKCAFVATDSICQGEQAGPIWSQMKEVGASINFVWKSFKWESEASSGAFVYVVIVGFTHLVTPKIIYQPTGAKMVTNINAYLIDAPDVFIFDRKDPICKVPKCGIGNKPIDGGNYLFKEPEMIDFIKKEPRSKELFHPWMGADEFLKNKKRYVLWLGDLSEEAISAMPLCRERVEAVQEFRLNSKSKQTIKLASKPTRFHVENMPTGDSIIIPETTSRNRQYIPLGFIGPEIICSNLVKLVPNASLYHYGVLQSQFHNAWMRVVAGYFGPSYRYSVGIVYNNFIWPGVKEHPNTPVEEVVSKEKRKMIEVCAQAILDIRSIHSDSSLADLYDPGKMPSDLLAAHKALDKAVEEAYGVDFSGDEEKIISYLFNLYSELTKAD